MARESESQKRGTQSVERAGSNLGLQADQRQREKRRRQGILLEGSVVGILPREQPLRKIERPAEVGSVLVSVRHQEPAEDAAGRADRRRNYDAQLHEEFFRA